ncbi:hypothetical protein NP233_g4311 [Leucocoprinus birnbaumii]|uniref:F-box domain-containing protein n=1 Tax=Leucocoprinus birnbaumii TaxID=56174 RepID=A0AAD5VYN3_9AGAR|nr:hypothetical protein NP233_g4311 [Leucocoprinus birnbaumii]
MTFTVPPDCKLLALPDDVLLSVLGLLTAWEVTCCGLVCRRLYDLSFERTLWLQLVFFGNFGYVTCLPQSVDNSTATMELRMSLARGELTERRWGGLVQEKYLSEGKKPSHAQWLSSFPLGAYPLEIMNRWIVLPTWSRISECNFDYTWYPISPEGLVNDSHHLPVPSRVFSYIFPETNSWAPYPKDYKHPKCYSTRVIGDELHVVFGKMKSNEISLHFTKIQTKNAEFSVSDSYMIVPLPLRDVKEGKVQWLDDNNVLVIDFGQDYNPGATLGNVFLVKRNTKTVYIVPLHPVKPTFSWPGKLKSAYQTGKYELFWTPSYLIQVMNGKQYEAFDLQDHDVPSSGNAAQSVGKKQLRLVQAGEFYYPLYRIWHVQEHSPSKLTMIGLKNDQGIRRIAVADLAIQNPSETPASVPSLHDFRLFGHFLAEPQLKLLGVNSHHPKSQALLAVVFFAKDAEYHALRFDFGSECSMGQGVFTSLLDVPPQVKRGRPYFFWKDRLRGQVLVTCDDDLKRDAYVLRVA